MSGVLNGLIGSFKGAPVAGNFWLNTAALSPNFTNMNIEATATDSSGNFYIYTTEFLGSSTYIHILEKYSPIGILIWRNIFENGGTTPNAQNTEPSIYVDSAGVFVSLAALFTSNFVTIIKFSQSTGAYQSAPVSFNVTGIFVNGHTIDNGGNYIMCGRFYGVIPTYGGTGQIGWVSKWNSSGVLQWSKSIQVGSTTQASSEYFWVGTDSSANIYAVGKLSGYISCVKMDSSGSVTANNTALDTTITSSTAVITRVWARMDSQFNIYTIANYYHINTAGFYTMGYIKFANNMIISTQKCYLDPSTGKIGVQCYAMDMDSSSNIYIACGINGGAGGVVVINSSGAITLQFSIATSGSSYPTGISYSPNSLLIAGNNGSTNRGVYYLSVPLTNRTGNFGSTVVVTDASATMAVDSGLTTPYGNGVGITTLGSVTYTTSSFTQTVPSGYTMPNTLTYI
jgi:hypothetical protein